MGTGWHSGIPPSSTRAASELRISSAISQVLSPSCFRDVMLYKEKYARCMDNKLF